MSLPGRELLIDAVKGAVLTLALFLAYVTFPVIGLAAGILAPLPAIFFYLKRGATAGLIIFTATLVLLAAMGDGTVPLLYLLQSGLISILTPFFYLNGKGCTKAIAYAVFINALFIIALAVGYGLWSGADLNGMLVKGIETSSEQAILIYGKQGLSPEELELFSQGIRQAGTLIAKVFPALVLVALGMIAAFNMALIFRLKNRLLPNLPEQEPFVTFKNPDLLVWVVIIAGFTLLAPLPEVSRIALNILIVTGFIYFLQGLAVVLAFFKRIAVPSLARVIFWLALAFQPYLVLAIAILGLFDIWGDFRTPKQKNL